MTQSMWSGASQQKTQEIEEKCLFYCASENPYSESVDSSVRTLQSVEKL